jgi:hypothetical protein
MSTPVGEEVVATSGVVLVLAAVWLSVVRSGVIRWKLERREHARASAAHAAAVEASLGKAVFSPDLLMGTVDELVGRASQRWGGQPMTGAARSDDQVLRDWADATMSSSGRRLQVLSGPTIDFLQVVNRDGQDEDLVVLRVRLRLHREGRLGIAEPRTVTSDTRWTLGRSHGDWQVLSITSDPLAMDLLTARLVADPSVDEQRLREQALAELSEDSGSVVTDLAGLVSADAEPDRQLLELAMIDQRFDRQLIDATVGHVVQAWEVASAGGGNGPLETVASTDVINHLLAPFPRRLLVLRDAKVEHWSLGRLVLSTSPPKIEIGVTVSAIRYLVTNPKRRHVTGSTEYRHEITLGWTLALGTAHALRWHLIHTTNPAASI